jgi:hypothetical protein
MWAITQDRRTTGRPGAFAVAYILFALMLLFQIADVVIAIVRAW